MDPETPNLDGIKVELLDMMQPDAVLVNCYPQYPVRVLTAGDELLSDIRSLCTVTKTIRMGKDVYQRFLDAQNAPAAQ